MNNVVIGNSTSEINNSLFEYEFKDIRITKKLKNDILKHPEKYSGCNYRIRTGLFYTEQEKEKYIEESLKRPLPVKENSKTLTFSIKRKK